MLTLETKCCEELCAPERATLTISWSAVSILVSVGVGDAVKPSSLSCHTLELARLHWL